VSEIKARGTINKFFSLSAYDVLPKKLTKDNVSPPPLEGPLRKSRYTEEQIILALKQHEAGRTTAEICRKLGVSEQTFYR